MADHDQAGPGQTDCIVGAATTGAPAQYTVTGRDFAGGMQGTTYRVDGPGEIVRVEYVVGPDGAVTFTEEPCASLTAAEGISARPVCS